MNFRLEKIERLSGKQASVYALVLEKEEYSVFEQFLVEHEVDYLSEVKDILSTLKTIGHKTGACQEFFKEFEGKYGDLVCALYDDPDKKLRIYGLKWGGDFVILGGGGPKTTRSWQEDTKLTYHAELMIRAAEKIHQRFKDGELKWVNSYKDISGDLIFKEEDYE